MTSAAAASDIRGTRPWAELYWLAGTAVAYGLLAKLILSLCTATGMAPLFWPGAGLALAAVLLGGPKYVAAIFVGAFAGRLWAGQPPETAAIVAVGSVFEPLLGAWLLSRKNPFDLSLRTSRAFFRLCFLAAAFSPCLATLTSIGALAATSDIADADFWPAAVHCWMGDTLGILIVAPLVLVWRQPPSWALGRLPEVLAVLAGGFLIGQFVFFDWFLQTLGPLNRGYWLFLVVSWAAVRLGRHGVLLAVFLTAVQAFVGTAFGLGLFHNDLALTPFGNYWPWTATLAIVGISLAIVFSERERIAAQLRSSEYRLRVAKNAAGLGVFDHDIATDQASWDERMRKLWGIGPEELATTQMLLAGVHPEDRAATEATMACSLFPRTDGSNQAVYRVVGRDDGRIRHVMANWKVLFKNRQPVRMIGTVRDVSEHKRLKQELQERRGEME
ncbi:MAG TPA: MASE1 domain-containing protein, partial [Rhodocyclaceae bacterium]|nr:MASE1 domain-containing protein [Rhodocyclaceae bacterium]